MLLGLKGSFKGWVALMTTISQVVKGEETISAG